MRTILLIFFMSLTAKAVAPDLEVFTIIEANPVNVYDRIIKAVVKVESSGDTLAWNIKEEAYGAFQIRPIRLHDYNVRTGKNYLLTDCYRFDVSREIFLYYARQIGYPNYESIARRWNGSGKMTLIYWQKVQANL